MAIPKVIHYCWFGGADIPENMHRCIDSWKKFCPDYKIVRWDESNYDYKKYKYTEDAYEQKKWAFVSDVARLDVIFQYGGIYLDTDVELIKPLDELLNQGAFMGFEQGRRVNTGLGFGAEKGNLLIKENLEYYKHIEFIKENGELNLVPCPNITTEILELHGLVREDKIQILDGMKIFSSIYFSPMILADGTAELKPETISIHHYAGSWTTENEKRLLYKRRCVYTKYGKVGLSFFDGMVMLKKKGIRAFLSRLAEIVINGTNRG